MTDEQPFAEQELQPETDSAEAETVETEEEQESDTFDRAYVEKLRAEAAEHRTKARDAQAALEASEARYRALAVEHAATGVLARPDALEWQENWTGDDGSADLDAIRAAATEYAHQYPHAAVVAGDVGQGFKDSATTSVDIAGMLRANA